MNWRQPILLLALLATTQVSHAQWEVFDPALQIQMIVSTAEEVAKFVEMVGNQVKQIDSLRENATTLHQYVDLFGNPATVIPASQLALRKDLEKLEAGVSLGDLLARADPRAAMLDGGGGIFAAIGERFQTPGGQWVSRKPELYRPVAALQQTTGNFLEVVRDITPRRAALKAEIARTIESLAKAGTDAEVQKQTAVLVGLQAALQGTEAELSQATASALVQDVATRADDRRQADARKERQSAEFSEALANYGKTFQLLSAPVPFP